jgi:hypothetical protein
MQPSACKPNIEAKQWHSSHFIEQKSVIELKQVGISELEGHFELES